MADTTSALDPNVPAHHTILHKKLSSLELEEEQRQPVADPQSPPPKEDLERKVALHNHIRLAVLLGLAALILAWWISSTVLRATRGRW